MAERTLTLRELNRTHLHRQYLLERSSMSTGDMLRAIVGLQAQDVRAPYLAMWSRLEGFQHAHLADMLVDRSAVRASLMRGTIHLVTADDYQALFPVTYGLHLRAVNSVASAKLVPAEHHAAITAQARELLAANSYTAAEIGDVLTQNWPDYPAGSLGQVVRFMLPLIQTPPRGVWGDAITSRPAWTLPHGWLDAEIIEDVLPPHQMIRRYLKAFGPASLPDIKMWSGVTNLKPPLLEMRDELVTYKDPTGVLLYDLSGLEIMPEDTPAPVRFLPVFDNALLGHKDRSRIQSAEARAALATQNGMFASAFLVDGFVAGMWRVYNGAIELAEMQKLTNCQQREVEQEASLMSPFWAGEKLPTRWVDVWKLPGKW